MKLPRAQGAGESCDTAKDATRVYIGSWHEYSNAFEVLRQLRILSQALRKMSLFES
tara:strand:- start:937 stop:1104 length:168 start_codon:yes stop_codon:yes gene_type:complete